jgi:hypothetical protein
VYSPSLVPKLLSPMRSKARTLEEDSTFVPLGMTSLASTSGSALPSLVISPSGSQGIVACVSLRWLCCCR